MLFQEGAYHNLMVHKGCRISVLEGFQDPAGQNRITWSDFTADPALPRGWIRYFLTSLQTRMILPCFLAINGQLQRITVCQTQRA